ncbi:MAG: DUF2089 domain-containing protein, partial [Candidatus Eisenbacteria bacterium]|nr:DUF2089 domain-containing protein [Candidatus Eisenbacteria bacterium]
NPMKITTTRCETCNIKLNGEFEVSALARLPLEDQLFVMAFLRHHGSIKKMEDLFGISYPTVKNKLNLIVSRLDKSFDVPSTNSFILDQLAAGEITVDEALRRMS